MSIIERNESHPASRVVTMVPGTEVGVGDASTAEVRITGPALLVDAIHCRVEDGVLYITASAGSGEVRAVNTGEAIVGEGGYANTGVQLTGQPSPRRRWWARLLGGPEAPPRITVRNTGRAIAGAGGTANTGVMGAGGPSSDELRVVVELPHR
jgi:hypothetical protein